MAVDERSRHQLYRKLDELIGPQEATTLMALLPPVGWADVATKQDLAVLRQDLEGFRREWKQDLEGFRREWKQDLGGFRREWKHDLQAFRLELHSDMDSLARRLVMWTSSMMAALAALAFAAGGLAF